MGRVTEQDASCLECLNQADAPWSSAWRAAQHSVHARPEILGGFPVWFHFHPECQDFRIWSDTLKFQDRVKYLLKGLCWCFGEKSTDCGAAATPVLHELSGSFSFSGTAALQLIVCLCQWPKVVSRQCHNFLSSPLVLAVSPIGTSLDEYLPETCLHSCGCASLLEEEILRNKPVPWFLYVYA